MGHSQQPNKQNTLVHVVRGLLGYICLIVFFSCVILVVQASMEEKRLRYLMTEKYWEKVALLDEMRRVENQVAELESYNRIADLTKQYLPMLGPARQAALEIEVEGLQSRTGLPEIPAPAFRKQEFLERLRHHWKAMGHSLRSWVLSFIE